MILHLNHLLADDSDVISSLICFLMAAKKFEIVIILLEY